MMTLACFALSAAVASASSADWHQVRADASATVWTRKRAGSGIHEIRAERIIDAPALRIWQVLGDVDHYSEFMPYVVEARVVATAGNKVIEYHRIDPPMVQRRDYTVQSTLQEDHARGHYTRSWHVANHQGPAARQDSIRLHLCDGQWTVHADADGQRAKVTYWIFTDPAGHIPTFLANRAGTRSVPTMLDALAKRAQNPRWHP